MRVRAPSKETTAGGGSTAARVAWLLALSAGSRSPPPHLDGAAAVAGVGQRHAAQRHVAAAVGGAVPHAAGVLVLARGLASEGRADGVGGGRGLGQEAAAAQLLPAHPPPAPPARPPPQPSQPPRAHQGAREALAVAVQAPLGVAVRARVGLGLARGPHPHDLQHVLVPQVPAGDGAGRRVGGRHQRGARVRGASRRARERGARRCQQPPATPNTATAATGRRRQHQHPRTARGRPRRRGAGRARRRRRTRRASGRLPARRAAPGARPHRSARPPGAPPRAPSPPR